MRHIDYKYGVLFAWLLLVAVAAAGCASVDDSLCPEPEEKAEEATLLVEKPGISRATPPDASSSADDIIEYLRTFNGDFVPGNKIRLANNLIGRVPDYLNKRTWEAGSTANRNYGGYFEYVCVENDTTPDGYYKFKPTDSAHFLRWSDNPVEVNDIFTNGSYYAFNALYCWENGNNSLFNEIGIDDRSSCVYGHVLEDQSTEDRFRYCDIMQAHHLKTMSQKGEVIKLRFWHQMAMVVINVSVPKESFGVGYTPENMLGAVCMLTNLYRGFYLPYNLDFATDVAMETKVIGAEYEEMSNIKMWPVSQVRLEIDKSSGLEQLVRTYAALVPGQIKENNNGAFCRFSINAKNYVYTPQYNVDLSHSNMTIIDLQINPETDEPVLLGVRILPWNNAYVPDFPLYPDTETNE